MSPLRPFALAAALLVCSACASTLTQASREGDCLRYRRDGDGLTLSRGGRRVPDDDLLLATADDRAASELAESAQLHRRYAIGALVLGAALLAPAIGTLGYGIDRHQTASTTAGGVLTVVGSAAFMTGVALQVRAARDHDRAFATYNANHSSSCHP